MQLQLTSCCDCSTTEGESELSTDQGTEQLSIIYLYKGAANICSFTIYKEIGLNPLRDSFFGILLLDLKEKTLMFCETHT